MSLWQIYLPSGHQCPVGNSIYIHPLGFTVNLVSHDGSNDVPQVDASEVAIIGWSQVTADVLESLQIMIQQIMKEFQELAEAVVNIYAFTMSTS